jgi:hypothetical protein
MKRQREFFAADAMAWRAGQQPGTEEKVLSRDATMLEIRYRVTAR